MKAKIIDGIKIAKEVRAELKERIDNLKKKGIVPGLGVILVGEDPASKSYVSAKEKACEEIGIFSDNNRLPENTTQEELLELIEQMNNDIRIDGILVQLPLPKHINENDILLKIRPEKDVDGFHPVNVGKMVLGQDAFMSCTPYGVIKMLEKENIETSGKNIVIIGRSNIVGKPLANMLIQKAKGANATVTVCHTGTENIKKHTIKADIIIAAAGRPNTLTADMIRKNAVVIDVGVNRVEDKTKKRGYRLVGDSDFDKISKKASYITPVPGGVGPMTITMLLYNTVESAEKYRSKEV